MSIFHIFHKTEMSWFPTTIVKIVKLSSIFINSEGWFVETDIYIWYWRNLLIVFHIIHSIKVRNKIQAYDFILILFCYLCDVENM